MKISIITINYNNYDGLKKTVNSVISQTCKNFEWIVIDGGSIDGSRELIEQYQSEMVFWCSESDRGIYHAMNKGIAKAHGEYLQFLNSGDVLESNSVIERILPYLKGGELYIANMFFDSHLGVPVVKPELLSSQQLLHTLIFKGIMHPVSFIKKDNFIRFGLYREDFRIISDWWFFYQLIVLHNISVSYIPVVAVVFNEDGISSTQHSIDSDEKSRLWDNNIALGQLTTFYKDNYDIVKALKANKMFFGLFRLYFFFYRKMNSVIKWKKRKYSF